MTSTRYALPVALLLTLALIPTVIHSYFGLTKNDGSSVKNIRPVLENFSSTPTNRNPAWGEQTFGSEDWFERTYKDEQGHSIRLFVARSFDHKRLYHHPELVLSYGSDLSNGGIDLLPEQPEIPVNLLRSNTRLGLAAYVLLYDGEFIGNPISHQVKDAFNLLISARKPMTLFYIADLNAPSDAIFDKTAAADLLKKAIKDFVPN